MKFSIYFRNPYDFDCMAPYGGPVMAGIAVGGYPKAVNDSKPDYKLATGIIITILINNNQDKNKIKAALEWELK